MVRKNQIKELQLIGLRTAPKDIELNPKTNYAWFAFHDEDYGESAVFAKELKIDNLLLDVPKITPVVLIVNTDNNNTVALVGYTFDGIINEVEYRFKGPNRRESIQLTEDRILKVFETIATKNYKNEVIPWKLWNTHIIL